MNKFKTLCIASSLVSLLGLTSCKKKQNVSLSDIYAARIDAAEKTQERRELIDSYVIGYIEPFNRKFEHRAIRNENCLFDYDEDVIYIDRGCDRTLDVFSRSFHWYYREEPGTEEVLKKAEEDYLRKIAEMGVEKKQNIYAAEKIQEREELIDGHVIWQIEPFNRKFQHYATRNENRLSDYDENVIYIDRGCDRTLNVFYFLDRPSLSDWYSRGERGTEEMFKKAEKDYLRKIAEMGVE